MVTRGAVLPLLSAVALFCAPAMPAAAVPGPPPLHQGWIVTEATPSRCLTGGPARTTLFTSACDRTNKAQDFYQTSDGHFTQGENCVQPRDTADGTKVKVRSCSYQPDQQWWFTTTLQAGDKNGLCLTEVSVDEAGLGTVRLKPCTGEAGQRWRSLNPW